MFLISIKSIDFHNIFFFGRWGLARITAWAGAVVCAQAFAAHLPNCSIRKFTLIEVERELHTLGQNGPVRILYHYILDRPLPSFTILGSYCEWPFAFALHPKPCCFALHRPFDLVSPHFAVRLSLWNDTRKQCSLWLLLSKGWLHTFAASTCWCVTLNAKGWLTCSTASKSILFSHVLFTSHHSCRYFVLLFFP